MKRYLVVAALFLLSLITYIDRAAISSAKQPLSAELALSDQQMGAVFSAFALGYALAQIPSGWFADRLGPRLALSAVVTLWSLFTALTGMVRGFGALLWVRFLFGVAGAVACFAAATFGADMTISPSWVYAIDLGGKNSGAISGSMNMLGNLGSFASANAFPWLYSWTGSASAYFAVAALLNLLSIVCWARMRPAERAPG
jgi:ACS family glucarate transporter-like MFS transporter